ncbi:MAG: HisA/HisF-related TIM barrel protein, partial [Christensenellales bacterium]
STDGAMAGTNLDAFLRLSQIDGIKITASGGITREEEIAALRDMGIWGAIIGKALYKGALDLTRAIRIAQGEII